MTDNVRLGTYIATLRRGPQMELEYYYVCGRNADEASARLASIAKVAREQILELKYHPDRGHSPAG
jgi:hypothetical protein